MYNRLKDRQNRSSSSEPKYKLLLEKELILLYTSKILYIFSVYLYFFLLFLVYVVCVFFIGKPHIERPSQGHSYTHTHTYTYICM